jgi:hypothetical protein
MRNKKEVILILIIFFCTGTLAISGVSPPIYNINFEPDLEEKFTFKFIFNDGVISRLSIEGDLAKYITLDKYRIVGTENVTATLKLPREISSPGVNRIRIGARQIVDRAEGIGLSSNVGGIINVIVPHSGNYVEVKLNIPDGNNEEKITANLSVKNLGDSSIKVKPIIQIFKDDLIIDNIRIKEIEIPYLENYQTNFEINTLEYEYGEYAAVALVDYEKNIAKDEKFFRVGELLVKINNYSKILNKNPLERYEIEIENLWNKEIKKLYATVSFANENFASHFIELMPWEKKTIILYIDSTKINKEIQGKITLNYHDKKYSENILIKVNNELDLRIIFIILGLMALVMIIIILKRRKKRRKFFV